MNKEEFLESITAIGSSEDDVARRELLADLSEKVTSIFDDNNTLTENNKNLAADNEKLREANMKLFLRVGEQREPDTPKTDPTPERRSFKNLFDEKGNIK